MEHARVNGVELAYEVSGTGAPVLLIGGTGMPAVGWQFSQAPALVAAGYRVVTFASRGVAPSEAPPPPYRIADMAADTAALIEHLAIAPCFVVGVSLGGFVAEELSRTRPELVRGCVLIASAGAPTAYVRAKFAAERELFQAGPVPHSHDVVDMLTATLRFDALQDDDEAVSRWLAMLTQAPAAWASADGRLGQLHAEWSWMLDEDRPAGWAAVRVPCLVIAFQHDLYLPPRVGREAAQPCPTGDLPRSSAPRIAGTSSTRTGSTACWSTSSTRNESGSCRLRPRVAPSAVVAVAVPPSVLLAIPVDDPLMADVWRSGAR